MSKVPGFKLRPEGYFNKQMKSLKIQGYPKGPWAIRKELRGVTNVLWLPKNIRLPQGSGKVQKTDLYLKLTKRNKKLASI